MKLLLVCLAAVLCTAHALYSKSDDVVELTASNFNSQVINSDEVWLVEFYAPWCGHCKSLAPEWKKAATALKGIVKVGAVDMDVHQSVGGPYNVRGFPTIKVFGLDKNKAQDYNGARQAQGLVDHALSVVKQVATARLSGKSGSSGRGGSSGGGGKKSDPNAVVELTDSNFEKLVLQSDDLWLVEFFAPWCGHCKTLAPHWEQAATDLKGKVKLGALDATVHTVMSGRYGVRGFPTIKMFAAGRKDGEATEYDGGRTAADITSWALDKLAENIPAPELVQLTSSSVLKEACEEHQLCIVAVMPHILDCQSKCRTQYLDLLKRMGEKYKKRMWGMAWAEAGAQMELEEAFGMGGFGYPTMVALNARKMKFSLLMGPFEDAGINEFLRALAVGRGKTQPLKNAKLPEIVEHEAWDGKDGEYPVEEDIDLSDVDMDDLDDDKKDEL